MIFRWVLRSGNLKRAGKYAGTDKAKNREGCRGCWAFCPGHHPYRDIPTAAIGRLALFRLLVVGFHGNGDVPW